MRMGLPAAKELQKKLEQIDPNVPFFASSLIDKERNALINLEVTSERGKELKLTDQSSYRTVSNIVIHSSF